MTKSLRYKLLSFIRLAVLNASLALIPIASAYAFSPYSNRELDELEKQFVEQINQSSQVERNPLATEYINHIGRKIASQGQMKAPYFFIVQSPEINAFAGPGGYIGVNTQLILASDTESELAGVMAHEMAHVRLHHLYRMLEHQKQMRIPMLASLLASVALGVLNPAVGSGAMMASLTGFAQDNINYVRSNEKEADRDGINMLSKAGFDPQGMADFFKKMHETSRYYYTANIPAILRTHPLDEDRIAEAENRIQANKPAKKPVSSVSYYLFRELIRNTETANGKALLDFYRLDCRKKIPVYACQYGEALTLLNLNRFDAAKKIFDNLLHNNSLNPFYQIGMANAEIGLKETKDGLRRLQELYNSAPENYAVIMAYGDGLARSGEYHKAMFVYLKGTRLFPKDLLLCQNLARVQAEDNNKAYAYFTRGQCMMLQGKRKEAIYQLKQAQKYQKNDAYIQARIQAKIEELKQLA